jgi:hypothetical protein
MILLLSYCSPSGTGNVDFNRFVQERFERKIRATIERAMAAAPMLRFRARTSRTMSAGGRNKVALAASFCATLALAGCSSQIADLPSVGMPADAPTPLKEPSGYLPVNDLPPDRDQAAMDAKERAKIQAELIAARDRQAVIVQGKEAGAQSRDASADAK